MLCYYKVRGICGERCPITYGAPDNDGYKCPQDLSFKEDHILNNDKSKIEKIAKEMEKEHAMG